MLSGDVRKSFEYGQKLHAEHRGTLIAHVLQYAGEVWKKDALDAMDDTMLEALAQTAQPRDFSLNSGPPKSDTAQSNADNEPLSMPGVSDGE